MEWVETTGRSIEEAQEAALDELGVDEQDAEFEVIAEARVGLFGRLRSEARVRARVRPTAPRAKDDRRDRRRRRKAEGADTAATAAVAVTGDDASPTAPTRGGERAPKAKTPSRPTKARPAAVASKSAETLTKPTDTIPEPAARPARPRRSSRRPDDAAPPDAEHTSETPGPSGPRRNPARVGTSTNGRRPAAGPDDEVRNTNREEAGQVEVALAEQGQVAQDFLRGLLAEMGLGADIHAAQTDEDTYEVDLNGDDLGLLIGQKGATLFALQDLTRTVVQRKTGASNGRINVDVGSYRHKRHQALARFAEQVAQQVRTSGSRKAMEPMNASDRKVVHDTITGIDGVATASEGEDPRRYVVVFPAD